MTRTEIEQFVRKRFQRILTARMTAEQAEHYVQEIADAWTSDLLITISEKDQELENALYEQKMGEDL